MTPASPSEPVEFRCPCGATLAGTPGPNTRRAWDALHADCHDKEGE